MPKGGFRFKQFSVQHDRCAMKVGTDGVLLGAWAVLPSAAQHAEMRTLDIGCGSGLIALMMAQRTAGTVVGVEIEPAAAAQAAENVAQSPWADRITIFHTDIQAFTPPHLFDVVVCNPPFFQHALSSPIAARTTARHTVELTFEALTAHAARLLSPRGICSLIVPASAVPTLTACAIAARLYPHHQTWVQTVANAAPKRCLLALAHHMPTAVKTNTLLLQDADGKRSEAYSKLTEAFYL